MEDVKKNTPITNSKQVTIPVNNDLDLINEYFNNGFNGTDAMLKVNPNLKYNSAAVMASRILNDPINRAYIAQRRQLIADEANLTTGQLIAELKAMAFADVTDYIGLNDNEIKALPHSKRRMIKRINTIEKTFKSPDGSQTKEIKTVYELHDKIKAIDMIGKHIGIYEAHNQQKQHTIDLSKASPEQLNVLLTIFEEQKKISQ